MHKKVLTFLSVLFLGLGCVSSSEETLEGNSGKTHADLHEGMVYTINQEQLYAPVSEPGTPVDTVFDTGDQVVLLKIQARSLNDSALLVSEVDTLSDIVKIRKEYFHNGVMDFKVIDGDSTWRFSVDKMIFADVVGEKLARAENTPRVSIRCIDPHKSLIIMDAFFCYLGTDACNDGFAMVNYRKRSVRFAESHGGMDCGSDVDVIGSERIVTCSGLYDYQGNRILEFKDYIVLSERIGQEAVMLVQAKYLKDKPSGGFTNTERYTHAIDTLSENVTIFDLNGEPLYGFAYHGWMEDMSYWAPSIRSEVNDQIYLFDFKRKKYFAPDTESENARELKTKKSLPAGCKEYELNDQRGFYTVFLDEVNKRAYLKG